MSRLALPDYTKPIATSGSEIVMSRPGWYRTHGGEVAVMLDARSWPPKRVDHAFRIAAAARASDGRWACVVHAGTGWHLAWFESIAASPAFEPLPVTAASEDADPVDQLHVLGDLLVAITPSGELHVRDRGSWRAGPKRPGPALARTFEMPDGTPVLSWGEDVYDRELVARDGHGCTTFVRVPHGPLLALHQQRLVEVDGRALIPHLAENDVHGLEPAYGGRVRIAMSHDTERGTEVEHALYDPRTRTVTLLPETSSLAIAGWTGTGDLLRLDDRDHALVPVTAAELAALPAVRADELPVHPPILLPQLAEGRPAARPIVATTGDAIAILAGLQLRMHVVDRPIELIEYAVPPVAIAAEDGRFAVLGADGELHVYGATSGALVAMHATHGTPRSLAVTAEGDWLVIAAEHVRVVETTRTATGTVSRTVRTLELAGALAADADAGGEILFTCEGHRLVVWRDDELHALPPPVEPILAVAALGDRRFVCVGPRDLYLLDLAMPELVSLGERLRRPHVATCGSRLAMCSSAGTVHAHDVAADKLVSIAKGSVHYSSYSEPDGDVTVRGLAFMDDRRLVIALDEGRANIVDPDTGAALKLDPQPDDVRSRWIFLCGGSILIAD